MADGCSGEDVSSGSGGMMIPSLFPVPVKGIADGENAAAVRLDPVSVRVQPGLAGPD